MAAGLIVAVAGCGSDSGEVGSTAGSPAPAGQETATPGETMDDAPPSDAAGRGTTGTIAAIDGTTLQVQGDTGQVAVSYTSDTQINHTVAGSAADLTVGVCATVQSDGAAAEQTSEIAATRVSVYPPAEDGTCHSGPASGTGNRGEGGERPSSPGGRGTGGTADEERPSAGTSGLVSAVEGETFTLDAPVRDGDDQSTSTPFTVTTSAETTWSMEASAGPEALVEGSCVVATGDADETGAVLATSISVRPAEDGQCGGRTEGGDGV